ncbi:aldolase/citrate lyase family protein [Selenomonas sp. KH1T6]|uniref:aldolase/citrate lyase family protein n=1 Tax=Selenomonas sp. KH1T6 TaxID=3158784 RepID=UPI0008A788F8|nr:2-keto-3-deoxy-L-rhamnonate aldolase RhmA [Selenomonas ruminantium]
MALKLMYITNRPDVAKIAEENGVDRIFVDMEYIGKKERQGGMDTVQSHHTVADVARMHKAVSKAELLVRVNPIHAATEEYSSSEEEIEAVIKAGADIVMLPFFKTPMEVARFLRLVRGRARTMLLLETPEAVDCLDEILALHGIDEMFIGLNDLSLGYGKKFMFDLLADGTVESLAVKFRRHHLPFGFGGIARLGQGALPAERILAEHCRLGSSAVILSRSFCNVDKVEGIFQVRDIFAKGVPAIRACEAENEKHFAFFQDNIRAIREITEMIG